MRRPTSPAREGESYRRHARHETEQAGQGRLPSCFTQHDTVDAWRHRRMHELLLPLIQAEPGATWLTVGDGSYGSDAYFLQQQGLDVTASSLTDHSLRIAAEKGYLKKYAAVNAEHIPFEDESFDFVMCKEAYHHFPRPAIAFYEMLRVAREAVTLIEPFDGPNRILDLLKQPAKKLLWGAEETIHFEPSGNFIFRIQPKEVGKMLTALGYSALAYKTFNDLYLPRYGNAKTGMTQGHVMTRLGIVLQDAVCRLRLLNPGLVGLICFKQRPSDTVTRALRRTGFTLHILPVNPYA